MKVLSHLQINSLNHDFWIIPYHVCLSSYDAGLKSISSCLSLSSLKLGICLNITDKGLSYIGIGCSNLRELDLYRLVA